MEMKKHCFCTTKWDVQCEEPEDSVQQFADPRKIPSCLRCTAIYWVNPQYEDMMFDLREMNR